MSENTTATWDLSLFCYCPKCEEFVDLLQGDDFWDGRRFDICEHGTPSSRDVEVHCPACGHEFLVDLEY